MDDDFDKLIEFKTYLTPVFSSDADEIVKYISDNLKNGAKILICTNYPKRLQEILTNLIRRKPFQKRLFFSENE